MPTGFRRGAPAPPGPWARLARAVGGLLLGLVALRAAPAHAFPFVYVANRGDNTVSVLDAATNTGAATVPVGSGPEAVAVGAALWLAWSTLPCPVRCGWAPSGSALGDSIRWLPPSTGARQRNC